MAINCDCKVDLSPLGAVYKLCADETVSTQSVRPFIEFCPLHAAAPEMLKALKAISKIADEYNYPDSWIKELIAKAEGKP